MREQFVAGLCTLSRGERVVICLPNSYELANVLIYCFEHDLVAVPLDPRLSKEKKKFIIEHSDASACIDEEGFLLFNTHRQLYQGDFLLIYTSGSTGDPKGVLVSKEAVIANARAVGLLHQFDKGWNHATCLPLYHCNALCMSLVGSLVYGMPFIMLDVFDPEAYVALIWKNNIKTAAIVPALLERFIEKKLELPDSFSYFITAAAPLSSDLAERFYRIYGPKLVQGYGLSEAVNFSFVMPSLSPADFVREYINSHPPVGVALPGTEVRLDASGEVLVSGPNLMREYYKNKIATVDAFTQDGFLHTGDMGYFRGNYLVLNGRKKEIINRGGETIYPLDIEEQWRFRGLDGSFVAVPVVNNQLGEDIGLCIDTFNIVTVVDQINAAIHKPSAVQTGPLMVTAVGKPQRKKMGARLLSRSVSIDKYLALDVACRRVARSIIQSGSKEKRVGSGEYIWNEAQKLLSTTVPVMEQVSEGRNVDGAIFDALALLETHSQEILTGAMSGIELMKSCPGLWNKLMIEFPMGEYAKFCADFLIQRDLLGGRVVELGSGVGNTSNLIADHISGEYIRTDIGKDLNRVKLPGQYQSYNFDEASNITEADVVFATNALHCATDKLMTLGHIYGMLREEGFVLIAEGAPYVSNNMPWCLNMFYGLFGGWWDKGGFVSRSEWIFLLQKAGFKDIGWAQLRAGRYDLGGLIWGQK